MLKYMSWSKDLRASLVVFLVALPLCLGIALASQAPIISGLIAGIIGGLVVGFLSNSQVSVSGPAAGLVVVVIAAINQLGDYSTFTLAVFLSGLIQIVLGRLKAGGVGNYIPSTVIKGMLCAIGILIFLKQIPHAFGIDTELMSYHELTTWKDFNLFTFGENFLREIHPGATLVMVLSIAILTSWNKINPYLGKIAQQIPAALIAVGVAIFVNGIFLKYNPNLAISSEHLINLPFSGVSDFVANFIFPDWSQITNPMVWLVAVEIAAIGSIESLLSIDAAEKIDPLKRLTDRNRELFAQGVGNSLSGLLGGLPITAVIVRTSANVNAQASSKLSAIMHGFWLLLSVLTIPQVLKLIPLSSLAAILILVGLKLASPNLFKQMYRKGFLQFAPFIVTVLAILATDLLTGIVIGLMIGMIFSIFYSTRSSFSFVEETNHFIIKFNKDINFFSKSKLRNVLAAIPEGSFLLIVSQPGIYFDEDIIEVISEYSEFAKSKNIELTIEKNPLALSEFFKY